MLKAGNNDLTWDGDGPDCPYQVFINNIKENKNNDFF